MTTASNDASVSSTTTHSVSKPKNVSSHLWEKFKSLEKRTDEVTRRSTEKRIKQIQRSALENVTSAFSHPDDSIIVNFPIAPQMDTSITTSHLIKAGKKRSCVSETKPKQETRDEQQWEKVKSLLNVNSHLDGIPHGNLGPKTVLELQIEEAVAGGDFKKAEELSDYMATREFGEKIAKAIDAKNFLEHKEREEEEAKAKRRKKLHWGFEAKQRWETKGNM